MFDCSPSLNDVVPVFPMLLSVDVTRKEKSSLFVNGFCVSSVFCLHNSD